MELLNLTLQYDIYTNAQNVIEIVYMHLTGIYYYNNIFVVCFDKIYFRKHKFIFIPMCPKHILLGFGILD